jgi:hypothetical protein
MRHSVWEIEDKKERGARELLFFVGFRAFMDCASLTDMTLPASLTEIDDALPWSKAVRYHVAPGSYAEGYCREQDLQCVYDQ